MYITHYNIVCVSVVNCWAADHRPIQFNLVRFGAGYGNNSRSLTKQSGERRQARVTYFWVGLLVSVCDIGGKPHISPAFFH